MKTVGQFAYIFTSVGRGIIRVVVVVVVDIFLILWRKKIKVNKAQILTF